MNLANKQRLKMLPPCRGGHLLGPVAAQVGRASKHGACTGSGSADPGAGSALGSASEATSECAFMRLPAQSQIVSLGAFLAPD